MVVVISARTSRSLGGLWPEDWALLVVVPASVQMYHFFFPLTTQDIFIWAETPDSLLTLVLGLAE